MPLNAVKLENARIQGIFEKLFVTWNNREGPRGGLHASSILNDVDFCYREHVLGTFYQREVSKNASHLCAIFLDGWITHEKWQNLFTMMLAGEAQENIDAMQESIAAFFEAAYGSLMVSDEAMKQLLMPEIDAVKDQTLREKWQFLFDDQVASIADEVEQSHYMEEWGLSFTPDAIIRIPKARTKNTEFEQYVVEIKGYNKTAYEDIVSREDPMGNGEFKKAAVQANLYMHMLGIQKAIILIENKGDQHFQTWIRHYDAAMAEPYIEKLNNLKKLIAIYRKKKLLIDRLDGCTSSESERAKKCPLRTVCFLPPDQREHLAL